MSKLVPILPLNGYSQSWPGLELTERYLGELISIACILDEEKAFLERFKKTFGKAPPQPNQGVDIEDGFVMWTAPGQYMAMLRADNIHADADVAAKLAGAAYTTLQSDGWASIHITGERIYDVLERFIPLELRRRPNHFAARTSAHHVAVIIVKFSETDIYLLTPRSSAQSFLDSLVHTIGNVHSC